MDRSSPSITAEDIAAHRAFEMLRPKHERVCQDPFARYFVSDRVKRALRFPLLGKLRQWIIQKIHPGGPDAVIVRARFIDDLVAACVQEGLEQLVILGAGYDCRPYRMRELRNGISIFEIDHPPTQAIKIEKLNAVLDQSPDHVVFIPWEINETGLEDVFKGTAYDASKCMLFIMEGLVMYLASEAIGSILSFISKNSGAGSAVVFDYLPPGIEDGTTALKAGRALHNWAKRRGEPFQFGTDLFGTVRCH